MIARSTLRGMRLRATLLLSLLVALPVGGATRPSSLTLATWNLEWLLSGEALRSLAQACARGARSSLPCDVPARLARGTSDLAALARHARTLDADVVALQEVEGPDIARRVFPGYEFCFSARRDLQNVGFAIRRGLAFRCGEDYVPLSLGDRVRRGAELVLFPGTSSEMHLLAVHLKSGCATALLDSGNSACATLARQAPILEAWIDTQARAGHAFAVLGDFNRQLIHDGAHGLWGGLQDGDPPGLRLQIAGATTPFRNCHAGQTFTAPIDYIVLGGTLTDRVIRDSFQRLSYRDVDAHRHMLSDHCPVAIRLRLS